MEIDVRQRNQRSIKRRERAQRMQAAREQDDDGVSGGAGVVGLLSNGAGGGGGGGGGALLDSADEDELPLLKRSPAVVVALVPITTTPPAPTADPLSGGSIIRRHKKIAVGGVGGLDGTAAESTVAAMVKEEVSVDWLKMEPRLVAADIEMEVNGVGSMEMDGLEEEEGEQQHEEKEETPLLVEDVIDGFSILAFKSYEDLEVSEFVFQFGFFVFSSQMAHWDG